MLVIKHLMVPIDFHNMYFPTMEVNGDQQQFASSNVYRFATTWGWVNDDKIYIFGWTIGWTMPFVINIEKQ